MNERGPDAGFRGVRWRLAAALIATSPLWLAGVLASQAADNAREIVNEAQKRATTRSERYEGVLQTFVPSGKTSEKRWVFERVGSHGQSKVIIRFTSPSEVKGVALLVFNHPDRLSDQWMWTPAVERDRRIALQDRSTRFFGTDFTFEDLEERDVDQYDYALLGDEEVEKVPCWKIRATPKVAKSSQYTNSIVWVRKDNYAFARGDFYVKDQVVRQLKYLNLSNIQGVWTAGEIVMSDFKRGSVTSLKLEKVEYDVSLDEARFTLQGIRRQ
jgi:outer membrane lipoprotein-sorting protein